MRRLLLALTLLAACSSSSGSADPAPAPAAIGPCGQGLDATPPPVPPIHTPRWAFEPWISKDISDVDDTYAFVDGFEQRGIPVGVVVLDSPWETSYNSLIPNPVRYRDFDRMVANLRARNIRTVLWLTAFINSSSFDLEAGGDSYTGPSSNFDEALSCGFFINDGQEFGWWKGRGGSLDFFNPKATAWWHHQLDRLLDAGVAGFKLDFGDSYVTTKTIKTARGDVPHQEYSEEYYKDFFAHGVARKGPEEYVTMVRPYDKSYQFEGRFFARKEHAPVAWVGDNRRDWVGMIDALDHIFRSAAAGYAVVGSDIGGYLDRDDKSVGTEVPPNTEAFLRWTALGALTPFMQLHGRANLTPWTVPERTDESVAAWRYWATLHRELIPFFYSLAEQTYAGGKTILRPEGAEADWPGDYRFHVGDAFLVAPLLDAGGKRDVALPPGACYRDWWSPGSQPICDQTSVKADLPDWGKIPLFVRDGAIIPLEVSSDVTGLGDASSAGALTVLVSPSAAPSQFTLHGEQGGPVLLSASSSVITLERTPRPVLLRIWTQAASATLNGQPLEQAASAAELAQKGQGFRRDDAAGVLWVRVPAGGKSEVGLP